jgi:Gpi18-like mannosyltransferase
LSLLLVSSIAGLLLTIGFYRLARLDCNEQQAWHATALLLCWPASVAFFLPYTETLFLLLSVYCVFAARHQRFWLAGLAGALATLTRQQGLFLVLPLAWEIWEASGRQWSSAVRKSFSLLFVPAAYALWVVYRGVAINDVHPDFSSIQGFLHTVMISPSSYEITERHAFLPPWLMIWNGLSAFWRHEVSSYAFIDLALSTGFIALVVLSWRYLRTSYRLYCIAIVLVSLSFYAADENPFLAMPRHLLLAFPVFIGLAARYQFRRFPFLLFLLVECQMGLLVSFVWQRWVP